MTDGRNKIVRIEPYGFFFSRASFASLSAESRQTEWMNERSQEGKPQEKTAGSIISTTNMSMN